MSDNYWDRPQCECEDCGKKFRKGDEGDNERFCLRCDYLSRSRDFEREEER